MFGLTFIEELMMLRCLNQFIIHAFIQSDHLMMIYHVQTSVLGSVKTIAKKSKIPFFHGMMTGRICEQ